VLARGKRTLPIATYAELPNHFLPTSYWLVASTTLFHSRSISMPFFPHPGYFTLMDAAWTSETYHNITTLHSITTQKTATCIFTAMKASNFDVHVLITIICVLLIIT
jgi:hypothetical protein